jgi:hypothetical protein
MAKPESPYFNTMVLGSAAIVGAAVYFDPLAYAFGANIQYTSYFTLAAEGGLAGAFAGYIMGGDLKGADIGGNNYEVYRFAWKGALGGFVAGLIGQGRIVNAAIAAALVIFLPDMSKP